MHCNVGKDGIAVPDGGAELLISYVLVTRHCFNPLADDEEDLFQCIIVIILVTIICIFCILASF